MGLKLRKPEKRSNFELTWTVQLKLEDAHFSRRRHLKLGMYSHIYSVSLLDFFVKLKDGCYKKGLGILKDGWMLKQRISYWVADSRGFKALFLH